MVCHCDNPKFLGCDLVNHTIGESAQGKTAAGAAKFRAEQGIRQNKIRGSLELGHERKPEIRIRAFCIKRGSITQLIKCSGNDNQLHFSEARTRARASAIGIS